jgi:putative ABC transport system permease protein
MRKLFRRLSTLIYRHRLRQELEEEMAAHREMMPVERQRHFGSTLRFLEEVRDQWGWTSLDRCWQDASYGARTLMRSPGFMCVAVLTLALGIGAVSAIATVVDSVLLQPPRFYKSEELVVIQERNLKQGFPAFSLAPGNYLDFRDHNHSFSGIAAGSGLAMNLSGIGEPEGLEGASVTTNFFQVMGAQPMLGRAFTAQEERPGSENVVVLSYRLWQRRFGGRRDVLGQQVKLNAKLYTVVGVMPRDFDFNSGSEFWAPLTMSAEDWQERGGHTLFAFGRLKGGVSMESAQADLNAIAARAEKEHPDTNSGWDTTSKSLAESLIGGVRLALWTLAAAVGFVLLIACANLANLLLSRSAARRHEIGIRSALGAARSRLVRQFLTESLLLAAAGAVLGLALAWGGTRLLVNLGAGMLPRTREIAVNGRVLAFTAAIAIFTVILFGLMPAILMAKMDVQAALRTGGRGSSIRFRRNRLRGALVICEMALSLVLLSGAGLLLRSFYHLRTVDPGFDPHGVLSFSVDLPDAQYHDNEQKAAFYDRAVEEIRALPGVSAVGIVGGFPLSGDSAVLNFVQLGKPPVRAANLPIAMYTSASPEYFAAMRIRLKAGRGFTPHDNAGAARVAVVSEAMAREFYRNENPLGQRLSIGDNKPSEIVGIVGDVRNEELDRNGRAAVYEPAAQNPNTSMYFAVRAVQDPAALIPGVRAALRRLDPELPLDDLGTVDGLLNDWLSQPRFTALLMAAFAGLALTLAMVGIYGVISYSVTQATQEIGIRMALGARGDDVLRMVLNQGGVLMAAGLAIGLPMALGANRLLASQLFEVPVSDPITYGVVSIALLATGLAACVIPARRAMRVDPMVALRNE